MLATIQLSGRPYHGAGGPQPVCARDMVFVDGGVATLGTSDEAWAYDNERPAYEVELDGTPLGRVDSDESVFVAWPGPPLRSRDRRRIRS